MDNNSKPTECRGVPLHELQVISESLQAINHLFEKIGMETQSRLCLDLKASVTLETIRILNRVIPLYLNEPPITRQHLLRHSRRRIKKAKKSRGAGNRGKGWIK